MNCASFITVIKNCSSLIVVLMNTSLIMMEKLHVINNNYGKQKNSGYNYSTLGILRYSFSKTLFSDEGTSIFRIHLSIPAGDNHIIETYLYYTLLTLTLYCVCYNILLDFVDTYAMSVSLSSDDDDVRLVSAPVTMTTISCLSFVVYFDTISPATLSLNTVEKVSYNYSGYNYSTLGILRYPFSKTLFSDGESTSIFRIRLSIPAGDYHVLFIADGSEGSVFIWDVKVTPSVCTNSSKYACKYVCTYAYVCMYVCKYACMYVCIYVSK